MYDQRLDLHLGGGGYTAPVCGSEITTHRGYNHATWSVPYMYQTYQHELVAQCTYVYTSIYVLFYGRYRLI